ncbi:MAG: EscU/YscU/HrcU family type III secretion system export apparatus switch protein [bacterium]
MKKAVALRYEKKERAPVVVAKGQGYIAEKIIEEAAKNNIPIYTDPNLSSILMRLERGEEIPRELYEAVAKALAFVLKLDEKKR